MRTKPGIYETEYGNAAEVKDWDADWAFDLDMGQIIPIEMVDHTKFIRSLD